MSVSFNIRKSLEAELSLIAGYPVSLGHWWILAVISGIIFLFAIFTGKIFFFAAGLFFAITYLKEALLESYRDTLRSEGVAAGYLSETIDQLAQKDDRALFCQRIKSTYIISIGILAAIAFIIKLG